MIGGFEEYGERQDIEDADEDAPGRPIIPFPNPSLEECPVVPLGFTGGKLVFAMPEGEIRHELASKVGSMIKIDIFACKAGQAFLSNFRDRDEKFMRDQAAIWFVRQCRGVGKWDTNRTERALGVWPSPEGVVLHAGDALLTFAPDGRHTVQSIIEALRAAVRGPLYRLCPPAPRPGKPSSSLDGHWVRKELENWQFEAIGHDGLTGADVVAGWLAAALLGAVAPFRGHLLVNAMAGSGKTTLLQFIQALMAALAVEVIDDFTDAGLRNDLAGNARPALIDEAEASHGQNGPGPVERALDLLRRMSTGQGSTRKHGDIGGGTVKQTAVGAVMLVAISTPKLGPADASRMVSFRLLPLPADGASPAQIRALITKARELGPGLLGRVLKGVPRYLADVEQLIAAMARAKELPRTADLVAMLAAGRRLLMFDEPLTAEEADDEVTFWRPLLEQRALVDTVQNPGADALAHLMVASSGQHRGDRVMTIGDLVQRWAEERDTSSKEALMGCGIRVYADEKDGRPWLIVANNHPTLARIYEKSRWPDWRASLAYLDAMGPEYATRPGTNSLRYGVGIKQRGLCIPLAPWLGKAFQGVPHNRSGEDDVF